MVFNKTNKKEFAIQTFLHLCSRMFIHQKANCNYFNKNNERNMSQVLKYKNKY